MAVVSKDGVPDFGPAMENEALFKKGDEFKQFFYTKRTPVPFITHSHISRVSGSDVRCALGLHACAVVLNAERASYCAPILGNKLTRTRTALLKDLAESYM